MLEQRLVRQSVLNGSKKRIYDAEYGYDMNNNVSKFTSSAGFRFMVASKWISNAFVY